MHRTTNVGAHADPFIARFAPALTLPDPLPEDPFPLFEEWHGHAVNSNTQPNPTAMSLATIDADGAPSVRIVLCRGLDVRAGSVTWFTNRRSRKGRALEANPRAAVTFHWDHADRQVRLEGPVQHCTDEESDAYFHRRPWESRLAAWASQQSQPLASRADLLQAVRDAAKRLGLSEQELLERGNDVRIPRPAHWGGYRLVARRAELWQGGPGRTHDRAEWTRPLRRAPEGWVGDGPWLGTRVQP